MEYTVTFTQQELAMIGAGLSEIPYKMSAPVLAKLQEQIRVIETAKAAETKTEV